jgi:hypothetical protein
MQTIDNSQQKSTEINNNHNTRKVRCERYQPAQSKTGLNWFAPNVMQLLLHIIQSPVGLLIVIGKNVNLGKSESLGGMYFNADTNHPSVIQQTLPHSRLTHRKIYYIVFIPHSKPSYLTVNCSDFTNYRGNMCYYSKYSLLCKITIGSFIRLHIKLDTCGSA